jgi:hypothetical protein
MARQEPHPEGLSEVAGGGWPGTPSRASLGIAHGGALPIGPFVNI